MIYDRENQKVISKSKKGTVIYDPLDWLAAITSHIPDKWSQNVHYYGCYSNKSRGLRQKAQEKSTIDSIILGELPTKKVCQKKWAELIQKVSEISPLELPKGHYEMRIIALIDDPPLVNKILKHLDLLKA